MQNQKLYPNPNIYFYLNNNEIIGVDAYHKNEYVIEDRYFERLKFWDGCCEGPVQDIDRELLSEGLLLTSPQTDYIWNGDKTSYLSFIAAHNSPSALPERTEDESADFLISYSAERPELPARQDPPHIFQTIQLPTPQFDRLYNIPYATPLKKRKTCRNFKGQTMEIQDFSDLIYTCFGFIHGKEWEEFKLSPFKSLWERKASPSATGVQAIEAYLAINNIKNIPNGFYKYNCDRHQLLQIYPTLTDNELSYALADQFWVKGTSCSFFLVADLARGWFKDNSIRVFTNAYLEAGHISQNLLLTATALGCSTWLTAVMREYYLREVLQLKENRYLLVSAVSVGYGSDDAIPKLIINRAAHPTKAKS